MLDRNNLISYLADKNGTTNPAGIFKRIKKIVFVSISGLIFSLVCLSIILQEGGTTTTKQIQMLLGLCIITGAVVFIFGLFAMCILLWDSFVSTYIANLDLKNDMCEVYQDLDHEELPILLAEIRSEVLMATEITPDRRDSIEAVISRALILCSKNTEEKHA